MDSIFSLFLKEIHSLYFFGFYNYAKELGSENCMERMGKEW